MESHGTLHLRFHILKWRVMRFHILKWKVLLSLLNTPNVCIIIIINCRLKINSMVFIQHSLIYGNLFGKSNARLPYRSWIIPISLLSAPHFREVQDLSIVFSSLSKLHSCLLQSIKKLASSNKHWTFSEFLFSASKTIVVFDNIQGTSRNQIQAQIEYM